jgi:hypothetical protein
MSIYRGFRADSLTRPDFVRRASAFVSPPSRLVTLCNVFLEDLGAPKQGELAARFAQAAETPGLDEEARALCVLFARIDPITLEPYAHGAEAASEQAPAPDAPGNVEPSTPSTATP